MIRFKMLTANRGSLVKPVLMLFMLAPTVGILKVWPLPSAMTTGLVLLSAGLFFAILLATKQDPGFRFNVPVFLFLGLVVALAVSVQLNSYAYETTWRWYLIAFIVCIMILVAASELKSYNSQKFDHSVSCFLWIGCFVYGIMSLLKYYGFLALMFPVLEPSGGRLSGMWAQPNLTTTMCWLGLLAGAVVASRSQRKSWWYVSILVFGWTLAGAASRMSWLMVVGLLALIFVSRLPRYRMQQTSEASRELALGIAVVVMLMLVVPPVDQILQEALVALGLLDQGTITSLVSRDVFHDSARLTEFSKISSAIDSFSFSQWLFGLGPGNYPTFSFRSDMGLPPEGLIAGTWLHSHNLFTMFFIEFGLFGVVVILAFVLSVAIVVLKRPMNMSRFFSIGGIGLLFIHSNLEFPLWNFWFLVLFCLLLTNLFAVREFKGDSVWLKPVVGGSGLLMILLLLVNVGYQYLIITEVAVDQKRDLKDYQELTFLANDSLMGPYAVLRKYRDFAPETSNIDWQLTEVRKMKAWQPRDLVVLREFSLLILKKNVSEACAVAELSAYRYPRSGPIMLDHALLAEILSPVEIRKIVECIESGLAPRGENILSMQKRNQEEAYN